MEPVETVGTPISVVADKTFRSFELVGPIKTVASMELVESNETVASILPVGQN